MIKETDKGIGFRIGDTIYLNKALKDYPNLYKAVLKHELEHTSKFTLTDLKLDLTGSHLNQVRKDYYKFLITHPKSLMMFLPAVSIDNKLVIDPIMLTLWIVSAITLILIGVFI